MAIITDFEEGDEEVTAPLGKAVSRSDQDVLATVLKRPGSPLPFLQAAIDVARERSGGLFRDPAAAGKVAAMAKAASAQARADAEENVVKAKEEARKLTERRRNPESRSATGAEKKVEGESESAEKDGTRVREPNAGNGLDLEKYSWTQELSEINIAVPVPPGTKSVFVVCEIEKNHLKVALKDQTPIIDGVLYKPVNFHNCFWSIEDRKLLSVVLSKENQKEWWGSVIRGDPELNIKKVKVIPSRFRDADLDAESRQVLQKAAFDLYQRQMGLPTSDEIQKQGLLKKFPQMSFPWRKRV